MERAWWLWHMRLAVFAALGSGCDERTPVADEVEADAEPPDVPDMAPISVLCESPAVLRNAMGGPTGYVRCENGGIDRVGPAACDGPPPGDACGLSDLSERGGGSNCLHDADCTEGDWGRCLENLGGESNLCDCVYGCSVDTDCSETQVCLCDEHGSKCIEARCRAGSECDSEICGIGEYDLPGCSIAGYTRAACRTPNDTCRTVALCPGGHGFCEANFSGYHCGDGPTCGRPLRAHNTPILAPTMTRHDWAEPVALAGLHLLDATDRAVLTRHWLSLAPLEHASVASFARFTLQLMALGAPADLVAAAQQAGLDEVRHARLCYGVAGLLSGAPLGPAALDLRAVTLDFDPETVLREVIREACIGETLGAAEAFELADLALDPTLAQLWRGIAEDELRHAALGWATLRWLLSTHPHLAPMAASALSDLASVPEVATGGTHLPRFGLLGPAARQRLHAQTLAAVVAPAAAAILG